jgi:hypothetical protein
MAQPANDHIALLRTKWQLRVPAIEALSTTFNLGPQGFEKLCETDDLPNSFVIWQKDDKDFEMANPRDFTAAELQAAWDNKVW